MRSGRQSEATLRPWPVRDKRGADTEVPGGLDMGYAIANHPGLALIDVQIRSCLRQQTGRRFAAVAGEFEFGPFPGEAAIGMMRAMVNRVEESMRLTEQPLQLVVNPPQFLGTTNRRGR